MNNHRQRVRHRNQGRFPSFDTERAEALAQMTVFGGRSRPCTFHQRGASPAIASGSVAAAVLSRADALTGTDADPGAELACCGEYTHVGSCFRQQRGCCECPDAGNALQQLESRLVTLAFDQDQHFIINGVNLLFEKSQMVEAEAQHSAVVIAQAMTSRR